MCIDRHITGSASQALMLPVWNVFFGLGVDVLLGQTKVNDVDDVFLFIPLPSDEKVFRFYISIDEVFRVHILHSRNLMGENTAKSTLTTIRYNHNPEHKVRRAGVNRSQSLKTDISMKVHCQSYQEHSIPYRIHVRIITH